MYSMRRIPLSQRWKAEAMTGIKVTPWQPKITEPGEIKPRRQYITWAMLQQFGSSPCGRNCAGDGGAHSESCLRFEKTWNKEEARELRSLAGELERPSGEVGAAEVDLDVRMAPFLFLTFMGPTFSKPSSKRYILCLLLNFSQTFFLTFYIHLVSQPFIFNFFQKTPFFQKNFSHFSNFFETFSFIWTIFDTFFQHVFKKCSFWTLFKDLFFLKTFQILCLHFF